MARLTRPVSWKVTDEITFNIKDCLGSIELILGDTVKWSILTRDCPAYSQCHPTPFETNRVCFATIGCLTSNIDYIVLKVMSEGAIW